MSLGQQAPAETRAAVDLGALDGLRSRRLDPRDPDRVRLEAELEVPIGTPLDQAVARGEAAGRALAAEGQAVAVRVVVVAERLPAAVGAIAVVSTARDGKGWSGAEVGWRASQVLVRAAPGPTDEDALLAAAVAQAGGRDEAARIHAAAGATGVPEDRIRAAWEAVRQYLGPTPP